MAGKRKAYSCTCKCGKDICWIDTDRWGRCAFDAEPKNVIVSKYGKQWVCVPPDGRIVRAIINTGVLLGDTLAYIPHFYNCGMRKR